MRTIVIVIALISWVPAGCGTKHAAPNEPVAHTTVTPDSHDPEVRQDPPRFFLRHPEIAENGQVVPLGAIDNRPADLRQPLDEVLFYNCTKSETIGWYKLHAQAQIPLSVRAKLTQTSQVLLLGIDKNGAMLADKQQIKVTTGGSGGGGGEPLSRSATAGRRGLVHGGPPSPLTPHSIQLIVGKQPLPVHSARVHVKTDPYRARVLLDLRFDYPGSWMQEGRFKLRLPNGAVPYYIAFGLADDTPVDQTMQSPTITRQNWREDLGFGTDELSAQQITALQPLIPGRMVNKQLARVAYENTVIRSTDPALLEWEGGGIYDVHLYPFMPGQAHRVVIGYDVSTKVFNNARHMQVNIPATVNGTDVTVIAHTAMKLRTQAQGAATRIVNDKQFYQFSKRQKGVLDFSYTNWHNVAIVENTPGQPDFFVSQARIELDKTYRELADHALFLLDASASRSLSEYQRSVSLIDTILKQNTDQIKTFRLMAFNHKVAWWQHHALPNNAAERSRLLRRLQQRQPAGATDIQQALQQAYRWLHHAGVPGKTPVIVVSDGQDNWGRQDWFDYAMHQNTQYPLFFYLPSACGQLPFYERIALQSGGSVILFSAFSSLPDLAAAYRYIPWHLNHIYSSGFTDILPVKPSRFYRPGESAMFVGKGKLKPDDSLSFEFNNGQKHISLEQPFTGTYTSTMSARYYGQTAMQIMSRLAEPKTDYIEAFSKHFRIPSKYASLLMLESEQEYANYPIEKHDFTDLVSQSSIASMLSAARWFIPKPGYIRMLKSDLDALSLEGRYVVSQLPLQAITNHRSVLSLTDTIASRFEMEGDMAIKIKRLEQLSDKADKHGLLLLVQRLLGQADQRPDKLALYKLGASFAAALDKNDLAVFYYEYALGFADSPMTLAAPVHRDYRQFLNHIQSTQRQSSVRDLIPRRLHHIDIYLQTYPNHYDAMRHMVKKACQSP